MLRNKHDSWIHFCQIHAGAIAEIDLPPAIIRSEHRFRELLENGHVEVGGTSIALNDLPPDQWRAFARFVGVFFNECESYAPDKLFPAFHREAARRGAHPTLKRESVG